MQKKFERLIHDRQGMTIVEVVVAMAIISLVLISLWEGYNLARSSSRNSMLNQVVAQTAQGLLSDAKETWESGTEWVETDRGRLNCTWWVQPMEAAGIAYVTLEITDEQAKHVWRFFTVKRVE